ncbi:MAG: lysoplasmalogenase [Crocinitomicaceae bacterium]|nr:lysoplasmalogenase [Crocinitomicaceae bacterium]
MLIVLFAIIVAISAGIAIYFRQKHNHAVYSIVKPLTTILIITLSIILTTQQKSEYGYLVILGLTFSLIGDVFLLKKKWFVHGLLSFLLAHLVFIFAFSSLFGFQDNLILLAILLIAGFIYFRFLLPHLKSFAIPVAIYFLAIIAMDWQAIGLALSDGGLIYILLGVSSLLFSFSDAVIAYNKFVREFKLAEFLILSTYWIAIFIIGASIAFV